MVHIVSESNNYALQIDVKKPLNLTCKELEQFIGILFVMSIVKMPSTRDYWDKNIRYDKIADIMPIKRFEQIKRFLHVSDNMQMPKDCPDKLFKIRPLIDAFKERFQMIAPTEDLCIDEQTVPFKGTIHRNVLFFCIKLGCHLPLECHLPLAQKVMELDFLKKNLVLGSLGQKRQE